MEFHILLFFFFFKYLHDLSTDLSKTLLFKASFLFKTSFLFQNLFPFFMQSHVFLCLYTIQVCEFYTPLSSFFLFLPFVQISNMDDNTNYQEDYEEDLLSDIFPLWEHPVEKISRLGSLWNTWYKKTWTCRLYLSSLRVIGKVYEMVDHLALSCTKVSIETRQIFLQEVHDRNTHPPSKKQKK